MGIARMCVLEGRARHFGHAPRVHHQHLPDRHERVVARGDRRVAPVRGVAVRPSLKYSSSGDPPDVVDDDPAPVAEWLPALAEMLGARKPMRVPRLVGRIFAGVAGAVMMTELRRASNAKAKSWVAADTPELAGGAPGGVIAKRRRASDGRPATPPPTERTARGLRSPRAAP